MAHSDDAGSDGPEGEQAARAASGAGRWAAELALIARAGGAQPVTPYDAHRYARIAELATQLTGASWRDEVGTDRGRIDVPYGTALLGARTPMIAAESAVFDATGSILLIRRADSGLWALPGGAAEIGNLPAQVAERETWEETGLRVRAERLVGLYAIPSNDGSGYRLYVLVFLCRYLSGVPIISDETLDVGYFSPAALPTMHRGHDRRVADAIASMASGETWQPIFG